MLEINEKAISMWDLATSIKLKYGGMVQVRDPALRTGQALLFLREPQL